RLNEEGVYGFKDGRPATFDTFTVYVNGTSPNNVKEFELLTADVLGGPYNSIGTFTTQNLRMLKSLYQEFKFEPVTAKHLKVKLLSNHGGDTYIRAHEFQLFGELATQTAPPTAAAPAAKARPNLLLASQGGELLAAPNQVWEGLNDGKEVE